MPILVIKILIALGLDRFLGEPRHYHPLVGFGSAANWLEQRLNRGRFLNGMLAWSLAVLPPVALIGLIEGSVSIIALWALDLLVLYWAIGRQSLLVHSTRVYEALGDNDLAGARAHTSMMVSRDCDQLDAQGCAKATIESVLENGNDSVFGVIFWFVLLGAPGVVLYRLANTLDAMWGYKTERFAAFGKSAALIDDALNYLPARMCALAYALAGNIGNALVSWRRHAHLLSSPNGGPVMCAGAGALNLELGGPASYHGLTTPKPRFGYGFPPTAVDILRANGLLNRSLWILMFILLGAELWIS